MIQTREEINKAFIQLVRTPSVATQGKCVQYRNSLRSLGHPDKQQITYKLHDIGTIENKFKTRCILHTSNFRLPQHYAYIIYGC